MGLLPTWYVLQPSITWDSEVRIKSLCRNLKVPTGQNYGKPRHHERLCREDPQEPSIVSAIGWIWSRFSRGYSTPQKTSYKSLGAWSETVNSLLGIVVVPKARQAPNQGTFSMALADLYQEGWPRWTIELDEPLGRYRKTERLTDLLRHLRNAAAHGRFNFYGEPDSRDPGKVMIMVEDQPDGGDVNWRCSISAESLYDFCIRLCEFIQKSED